MTAPAATAVASFSPVTTAAAGCQAMIPRPGRRFRVTCNHIHQAITDTLLHEYDYAEELHSLFNNVFLK